jgi:spore maturation protein CgeB
MANGDRASGRGPDQGRGFDPESAPVAALEADEELRHMRRRLEDAEARAAAFGVITRTLRETEQRLHEAERRLRETEGRYVHQVYRTDYVTWQLKSSFARRWWRLGEALWRVYRNPRHIAYLPGDIWQAARKVPMPEPPVRPRGGRGERGRAAPGGPAQVGTAGAVGAAGAAGAVGQTAGAPRAIMPHIPPIPVPDGPVVRPELTVAVILDPFSRTAFRYEWNQVDGFGPDDWREVLERTRPAFLFAESAWFGNDARWAGHMNGPEAPSAELRALTGWCREHGIPTVFWNKEDPPNFEVFAATATLFDHVFTTCGETVPRYRELLGHDRIGVLSFAAQPRIHNPVIVPGGRRHEVAFAGTYFAHKHAGRAAQMRTVLEPARGFGLHVYSRMAGGDERFQFPAEYDDNVVGSLPYDQMLAAYKSYKVFLNVNSVVDSPTMCARRIFELSACRTPVLSGYSRAIEEFFPGTVTLTRDAGETQTLLASLLANPELRDRQAHLAMREVLARHTTGHRVDAVLDALGALDGRAALTGAPARRRDPAVSVIMSTNRPDQLTHAIEQVARQHYRPLQLVLVLHGTELDPDVVADKARAGGIDHVVVRVADSALPLGACLNLAIDAADGELIAKMDDDDIYGAHYLSDLVPAFSYTEAGIVGKRACYVQLRAINATLLSKPECEHAYGPLVRGGTIVAPAGVLRGLRFDELPRGSDTKLLRRAKREGLRIYSADRFNYVYVRNADPAAHTFQVHDAELLRQATVEFYGPPEQHVCI